jgi:hypothetical protein
MVPCPEKVPYSKYLFTFNKKKEAPGKILNSKLNNSAFYAETNGI